MYHPNIRPNSQKAVYYTHSNLPAEYAPSAPPAPPDVYEYPINEVPESQERAPLMGSRHQNYSRLNESTAIQHVRTSQENRTSAPEPQRMAALSSPVHQTQRGASSSAIDPNVFDPVSCCAIIESLLNCCGDCCSACCSGC